MKTIIAGRLTALISFLIGLGIFLGYFATSSDHFVKWGISFLLLASLINVIMLLKVIYTAVKQKSYRKKALLTCGLMMLNIPTAIVFCYFSAVLMDTMRIKIVNETENELTDIRITGCGEKTLKTLAPEESEIVWIPLSGDCSIEMSYLENGEVRKEIVAPYLTLMMGEKLTHRINSQELK